MAGHIAMATIGTQGDVQPFVALGLALKAAGYRVTLATSADFQGFVEAYGLNFVSLGGHVQEFLKQSLFENAMSRSAIFNAPAGVALALEVKRQKIGQVGLVLDDQYVLSA